MRWVVAQPGPSYSVHDTYIGWVEALRGLGEKVIEFNLDDRLCFYGSALKQVSEHTFVHYLDNEQAYQLAVNGLYSTLYQARPDVLLVISGFFIPPLMLERAQRSGTRVVLVHTESPYEDERQLALAPYADMNLIDDPMNIDKFAEVAPTRFLPRAFRPLMHCPGPPMPALTSELAFVGTGYASRTKFFEEMNLDGVDVLLAGNWTHLEESSPLCRFVVGGECIDNIKTVQIYRSTQVGINLYRREAQRPDLAAGWAMGPREVEMAAIGLFFLRDPRPESDQVLDMLPSFGSPGEASELLRYWLARPRERAERAAKARAAVAERTFTNSAAALLRLLD